MNSDLCRFSRQLAGISNFRRWVLNPHLRVPQIPSRPWAQSTLGARRRRLSAGSSHPGWARDSLLVLATEPLTSRLPSGDPVLSPVSGFCPAPSDTFPSQGSGDCPCALRLVLPYFRTQTCCLSPPILCFLLSDWDPHHGLHGFTMSNGC